MDPKEPVSPEKAILDPAAYKQCRRCRRWFANSAGTFHAPWHWSRTARSTNLLLGLEGREPAFECGMCTDARQRTKLWLLVAIVFGFPLLLMLLTR